MLYLGGSGRHVRCSGDPILFAPDIVERLRLNTYNSGFLTGVPPWSANRLLGVAFQPRCRFCPSEGTRERVGPQIISAVAGH
jgi:hypothetical protein